MMNSGYNKHQKHETLAVKEVCSTFIMKKKDWDLKNVCYIGQFVITEFAVNNVYCNDTKGPGNHENII